MVQIPLPGVPIKSVEWTFDPRQLVNDSEFTGARQVVGQAGAPRWEATGSFIPMIGQDASLPLKAFQSRLKGAFNSFALPGTEKVQGGSAALLAAPAALTNAANMTITGRTATRTGGSGAAFDSSVISAASFTGGCVLMFRPSKAAVDQWVMGISTAPATNNDYTSIDYGFFTAQDGSLAIVAAGGFYASLPSRSPTDLLAIVYDNASVKFYRNGELVYTFATTAGRTFFLDSSFQTLGAAATDIAFHALPALSPGITSCTLFGLPVSTSGAVKGGWRATALHRDGRAQMLTIGLDALSDGTGSAVITFEPALIGAPYAIITDRPFAVMGLVSPIAALSTDAGQLYAAQFQAREIFK